MAPIVLGYWDIRGLAASIRYVLEYAGADWQDKLYVCGPPPDYAREDWLKEKFSLGLDFPNLPYLIDGDVKLSQSTAILRYLANKFNLVGKTPAEQAKVDNVATQLFDYHMELVRLVYVPQYNELKEAYLEKLPEKLKALSTFLGKQKFFAGDYVTYADFVVFEYLEQHLLLAPDCLKDFSTLAEFHKRVLALESIDKYFKSPKAIKYPFNGAPAYFAGRFSEQLNADLKK